MSTAMLLTGMEKDTSAILALVEGMAKAHYNRDVQAVAAPYDPDAAIFNLAPPLIHHGIDKAEKQAWFDTWEGPIEMKPQDFQVSISGDLAFCHGYMRMSGKKKEADHGVSFWMRETLCFERSGGTWKVVHEHTSVPFYMDGSLRPAFDLMPED